jgi:hypothetical protein
VAQPPGLACTLRPFQQKALAWMLWRESEAAGREYDNPLWERVLLNGRFVWFNQFSGVVSREEPAKLKDGPCGTLADEMGSVFMHVRVWFLGKACDFVG